MSINAPTSTVNSTTSSTSVGSSTPEVKKTSSDSSFKDEMDKVSSDDRQDTTQKTDKQEGSLEKEISKSEKSETKTDKKIEDDYSNKNITEDKTQYASVSISDANSMLRNDIMQMINNSNLSNISQMNEISSEGVYNSISGAICLDFSNNISMTQSDADFFINLTQHNDVSIQAVLNQASSYLNNGAEFSDIQQNVKISQTLLNAINTARENNQPLRIDFDQNISVILRIGKDGSFAANFIPGDKVVEQYLKNNIESLRSTFEEQDLPYSDLSYSNRGSKQQKEQRRNNQG